MTFGVVLLNQVISVALCGLFNRGSLFDFNYFASFDPFRGIHGYSFVYFCLGGLLWDCLLYTSCFAKPWNWPQ